MEYFTVENCTPEQLDELRATLFWADDTGPLFDDLGRPCLFPGDVPTWRVYQEYARTLFTNDDFFCTAGMG